MSIQSPSLAAIIAAGLCCFSGAATAREKPKPLIYLGTYQVKPAKADAFESVMKDFVKEMKKYDMPYSFRMYSTSHFTYYSVNEFDNYGMLDRFNADWKEVEGKIGPETLDKYHEAEFGAIDSFRGTLLRFRPEQSYVPAGTLPDDEKVNYVHWTLVHVDPSKRQEWLDLQKKWVELYKNGNVTTPYLAFTGDIGYKMPLWVYAKSGKSRTDYFSESEKMKQELGNAMDALIKQSLPLIKKVEEDHGFYRRDLSYVPESK